MFEDNVIVSYEIQGMKAKIMSMLQLRNEDIAKKIDIALTEAFNKTSVQERINWEVEQAISACIKDLSKSHEIRQAIEDLVLESIKTKTDKVKKR